MTHLFKIYFWDFWVWWYWFNLKKVVTEFTVLWNFILGYLKVMPMAANLFAPLYQDYTVEGRLIAFPIRLLWIICGSILQLIFSVFLILATLTYLAVPFIPMAALINTWTHYI